LVGNHSAHRLRSQVVDLVAAILFLLPEGQVLLEKFDDALGVTEIVFLEFVNLVEGFLKSAVSEFTGSLVVLHDLIVEHREVQGETELDGVAGWESNLIGLVVCFESILLDCLKLGTLCVLSDVAVVVADHLYEEGLGFTVAWFAKDFLVDHVNNLLAVGGKFLFDFVLVGSKCAGKLGVLGVLLNSSNGSAGSTLGTNQVLESDREEIAFIGGDIGTLDIENFRKEVNHVLEAFCLFSNTSQENLFFNTRHFDLS